MPDTVPNGKAYLKLEQAVLDEARRLSLVPSDFDLKVWSWYASGGTGHPDLSAQGMLHTLQEARPGLAPAITAM